jgi:hypothetical protein
MARLCTITPSKAHARPLTWQLWVPEPACEKGEATEVPRIAGACAEQGSAVPRASWETKLRCKWTASASRRLSVCSRACSENVVQS